MGGPIALWTKDYNGFCDVSCGPLQRLAWLKAVSHNGTSSRPSSGVAGKSFRENYFKIDYLFYLQNQYRGPMMPAKLLYKLLRKKVRDMDMNLVLWIWSTRTRTRTQTKVLVLVLVLTHFVSTRTRTHAKQSTRTRTQDLCTRPNPAQYGFLVQSAYTTQRPWRSCLSLSVANIVRLVPEGPYNPNFS